MQHVLDLGNVGAFSWPPQATSRRRDEAGCTLRLIAWPGHNSLTSLYHSPSSFPLDVILELGQRVTKRVWSGTGGCHAGQVAPLREVRVPPPAGCRSWNASAVADLLVLAPWACEGCRPIEAEQST